MVRDGGVRNLIATWPYDPHADHQATAHVAAAVAKITRTRLLFYAVWGWLLPAEEFLPITKIDGSRLNVTLHTRQKWRALLAHTSQYTDMIADDPDGFRLPSDLFAVAERDYEVFLEG